MGISICKKSWLNQKASFGRIIRINQSYQQSPSRLMQTFLVFLLPIAYRWRWTAPYSPTPMRLPILQRWNAVMLECCKNKTLITWNPILISFPSFQFCCFYP